MKNQRRTWLVIGVVALVIVAWQFSQNKTQVATGDPIKIGAIYPLTGYGQTWGENQRRGAELAIEEINNSGGVLGRPLKLIVEDNKTEVKSAVSAAQKLVNIDQVNFLISGWTEHVLPLVPLIDENHIITMDSSSGAPHVAAESQYLFRTWPSDTFPTANLIDVAEQNGWRRVAVAQTIGPWENGLRAGFIEEAEKRGLEVVVVQQSPLGTLDFRTNITKLQALNPDVVYTAMQTNSFIAFLRQSSQVGFKPQILWPSDLNNPDILDGVNHSEEILSRVIYPVFGEPAVDFAKSFERQFGAEPGIAADTAYDAMHMLAQAVNRADTLDVDVIKESFRPYSGASGQITLDENGDRSSAEVIVKTYRGGELVEYES